MYRIEKAALKFLKFRAFAAQSGDPTMFKQVLMSAVRHGRRVLEGVLQRGGEAGASGGVRPPIVRPPQVPKPGSGFTTVASGQQTLLAGYLARAARENLATELRRRFAKATGQLQCGSAPLMGSYRGLAHRLSLMAFVGIGVANARNEEWPEHGFDSVCNEIKELFQRKASAHSEQANGGEKLSDFEIGPMIAKGCNAAVYQAKLQEDHTDSYSDINVIDAAMDSLRLEQELSPSDQQFSESDSEAEMMEEDSDIEVIDEDESSFEMMEGDQLPNFNFNQLLNGIQGGSAVEGEEGAGSFDLAVKIMFNYDAASSAAVITREMQSEMVPAQQVDVSGQQDVWEIGHHPKKKTRMRLPPHPNIVTMWGGFVDDTPGLPGASEEYPHALPPRLHPEGCGRNKTMFLIMKRYSRTLRQHLEETTPSAGDSLLLLTQLVEAVNHLGRHNIAHRDIKSDNILIDWSDEQCPHLVVSDFGCCLDGDRCSWGLRVPYVIDDVSKGGNGCLMAPEVATARSGVNAVLDFSKSDLWAVGALAYEIFGAGNPFYGSGRGARLNSATYRETDLPDLRGVPRAVNKIVRSMLTRDPRKRPDAAGVATALHILLWAPQHWIQALSVESNPLPPSKVEVVRWLLQLSAEVLFERLSARSSTMEHTLKRLFLGNLHLGTLMDSFHWLWSE